MNNSGAAAPKLNKNAILKELNPKLLMSSEELAMKKFKNQAERNKLRAALKARYPLARQNQINQLVKANKSTIEAARKEKSALFNQRVSRIRNWAIAAAQLPAFGPLNKSNKNNAALKKDYEAFRKYYIQELNRIILHTGKSNWRSYGVGAATRYKRLRESAEDFRKRRAMNYQLARRAGSVAGIYASSPFNKLRARLGARFARTPGAASANEIQKILKYKQNKLNKLAQVQGQLATEQSNAATRADNNSNTNIFENAQEEFNNNTRSLLSQLNNPNISQTSINSIIGQLQAKGLNISKVKSGTRARRLLNMSLQENNGAVSLPLMRPVVVTPKRTGIRGVFAKLRGRQ